MPRSSFGFAVIGVVAAAIAVISGVHAQAQIASVSLKVSSESAPPGQAAQIKIKITDAKPIITGNFVLSLGGLRRVEGINLFSAGDDAAGIALVRGTGLALSMISPQSTLGTDPDHPLLTLVVRLPADAPLGTTFPVALDAGSLQLLDPAGKPYPVEIDSGTVVAAPTVTIENVIPGGATLPAGSVVSLIGSNFRSTTKIDLDDGLLAQTLWISPNRIDVVLGHTTVLHGSEFEAKNRDSRVKYYSYQRASNSAPGKDELFRRVVPLFRRQGLRSATFSLSGAAIGVAVQNIDGPDAIVNAELLTSAGIPVAAATLTVPQNAFVVRSVPELFGVTGLTNARVRLTSAAPVQMLGVSFDAAGAATPRLPL